jgi:glutathione synthase/RimK-type ligase-like ATP-grasp enzyme
MTKVLIISNKSDITSDFIVKELKERNVEFYRFNTEELTKSCSISLDFKANQYLIKDLLLNKQFDLKEFTSVYFRRPELPFIGLNELSNGELQFVKSEISYTLEGVYKILRDAYWVSPIYSIREAENKIYQLEIAQSIGFVIPDSMVTNSFEDSILFFDRNNECIIKPVKSGLIEDAEKSKVVFTNFIKERPSSKEQIKLMPNFFQSHIKKIGDVRVTMVGNKAFATLIHSQGNPQTEVDWRRGEHSLKHTKIELPSDILEKCRELLAMLNLRFGAIDFILDEMQKFTFLEINPNGQWAWIERQTGYQISQEIVNMLEYENDK